MKKLKLVPIFAAFLMVACHHAPVATDQQSSKTAAPVAPADNYDGPSLDAIESEYTLLQFDQAANAFKVIADESISGDEVKENVTLFGCPIPVSVAKKSMMPLKSFIDRRLVADRDVYARSPASFVKSRRLATCQSTCSCGVFADLLSTVDVRSLKRDEQKKHESLVSELQAKSARQGPDASLTCAKKQNWICGSLLYKYLVHASTAP